MYVPFISILFNFDNSKNFSSCVEEYIDTIEAIKITPDPYIDLMTTRKMIGDCLVFSLTDEGLKYWQHLCETQHACKDAAEYKLNTTKFTTHHKINDEINRIHLNYLYITKN